jgi:hypothetical protein
VLDKSLITATNSSLTNSASSSKPAVQFEKKSISTSSESSADQSTYQGIREDLYNFWFVELEKSGQCSQFAPRSVSSGGSNSPRQVQAQYESGKHTRGRDAGMDRCFAELERTPEYTYLREMFLIEYENCIHSRGVHERIRNLFNTVCLDIIAVRRMLIEYDVCCLNSRRLNVTISSTICSFANFNTDFIGYTLHDLTAYVIKSITKAYSPFHIVYLPPSSSTSFFSSFSFTLAFFLIFTATTTANSVI